MQLTSNESEKLCVFLMYGKRGNDKINRAEC